MTDASSPDQFSHLEARVATLEAQMVEVLAILEQYVAEQQAALSAMRGATAALDLRASR